MLAEAGEASKHARKLGRVMGVVAANRIKDVKEFLAYQQLATWRRENGFDRVEAVEKNWFGDHRSLPPTPEQYHAGLWVEVNALKAAISMPIRGGPSWQEYKRNIIRKIEQGEVSDEDFVVIKRLVETRDRDAAQVTVTQVSTVQHCSPIPKTPEPPPDVCFNLENNENEMDPGMEELTSSSASTGLHTPGQESPPNEGVWETGRITADSILIAGVDSSKKEIFRHRWKVWTREPVKRVQVRQRLQTSLRQLLPRQNEGTRHAAKKTSSSTRVEEESRPRLGKRLYLYLSFPGAKLGGFLFVFSALFVCFPVLIFFLSQVKLISKPRDAGLGRQSSR